MVTNTNGHSFTARGTMSVYINILQKCPEQFTALFDDDVATLQSLRKTGASLTDVDERGKTLLLQAIYYKRYKVFNYLLTLEDIPLNVRSNLGTPIYLAVSHGNEDIALKLIERGCCIDNEERDAENNTLLHWAVHHKMIAVMEKLIEVGADVNARNKKLETPLFKACLGCLVDEMFLLLFYGADPTIPDSLGETSIDWLAKYEDPTVKDFFYNTLYPRHKTVHLDTMKEVMEREDSAAVIKLFENTTEVIVRLGGCLTFNNFCRRFNPDYFKLFINKFPGVLQEVVEYVSLTSVDHNWEYFLPTWREPEYVENLCIILDHADRHIFEKITGQQYIIEYVTKIFKKPGEQLELLTKLVCCLLSNGVDLYHRDLDQVFISHGYCELFKIMLHMDITGGFQPHRPLMPTIFYDVNMTIEKYLNRHDYCEANDRNSELTALNISLEYFALPELKKYCINYGDEKLTARVHQLPTVPSLVELARNSARIFIINKYETRNSRQFYTQLEQLCIPKVYKQIIGFERKLYTLPASLV